MRTKLGYGVALALVAGVIAACGGTQGETIIGDDGGTIAVTDGAKSGDDATTVDTGTTVQVGGDADTGSMSTFIDSGGGSTPDTGSGTTGDTGTGTTGDGGGGGGVCPATCSTDSECQSDCPASAGAINCCDTVTSACFTSASTSCPDQTGGGGGVDSGGGGGY